MSKKLDDLIIGLQLQSKALDQGLKEVKKKLNQHSSDIKTAGRSYDELALSAGYAFYKITDAIKTGIDAFNEYRNASVGLKSIVEGTGNSFSQAQKFIESYTSDGLVPAANAATALKNLLNRGYTQTQAEDVLNRLKDSAAFGRQASLSLGEAVQSAAEGLKNENSILVDNAGVTKNVSVMWKEYAASIGKSVDDLTTAEKIQAEYNGIMKETKNQMGDAAKLSQEFAGAQSKNAKATKDMAAAFGGSLIPALQPVLNLITSITVGFTNLMKSTPELTAGVTAAATTFLGLVTVFTAVTAAIAILRPALAALNISFTSLMANPVVLALTALAAVVAVVATKMAKAKQEAEAYNAALEKNNQIIKNGITKDQIASVQEEVDKLKELSKQYDENNKKMIDLQNAINNQTGPDTVDYEEVAKAFEEYRNSMDKASAGMKEFGTNAENVKTVISQLEQKIKDASRVTLTEYNDMAKTIAQKRLAAAETENLIKAYKNAEKGSTAWKDAQKKLADQFPQFSTMSGLEIEAIEAVVNANNDAITAEWSQLQAKIEMSQKEIAANIAVRNSEIAKFKARKAVIDLERSEADSAHGQFASKLMDKSVSELEAANKIDQKAIDTLNKLSKTPLEKITGVSPLNDSTDYSSYENKALESAMKIHDHKVKLNQMTKEQELADLQTILKKYAKSADERMDLEERIFDVKQAIRDRDLEAVQAQVDKESEILSRRTDNSLNWITSEKASSNLSEQEEIDAYNRIIKYHQEYLNKIKADTKIGQDEKAKIIAEETKTIQEQQNKIYEIQKESVEKAVNAYIEAKQKQYDTEEELEDERLNKKLKDLDKEYQAKEDAMDSSDRNTELTSLYEQERKYANAATKEGQEKLKEIQNRIAELNKESAKESLEAEKEAKREAIEDEITANQKKYKQLREDLATEQQTMLTTATQFSKDSSKILTDSTVQISDSLKGVLSAFTRENDTLMATALSKLKTFVCDYNKLMANITNPMQAASNGLNATLKSGNNAAGAGTVINVTDNGDKYINGNGEVVDYTKELFNTAKSSARGAGVTI